MPMSACAYDDWLLSIRVLFCHYHWLQPSKVDGILEESIEAGNMEAQGSNLIPSLCHLNFGQHRWQGACFPMLVLPAATICLKFIQTIFVSSSLALSMIV